MTRAWSSEPESHAGGSPVTLFVGEAMAVGMRVARKAGQTLAAIETMITMASHVAGVRLASA